MANPQTSVPPATRPLTLDDLLAIQEPVAQHRVALSPDGRYLAAAYAPGTRLWLTDTQDGRSRPVLPDAARSWRPNWSPDGTRLAFYAEQDSRTRLWCWETATGEARLLCDAPIFPHVFAVETPRWSPDGQRLYVPLRPEGWQPPAEAPATPARAGGPSVEVLTWPAPTKATATGPGPASPPQGRDIGVVAVASGALTRLVTGVPMLGIFPSPDGRRLALPTMEDRPDLGRWQFRGRLFLLAAEGGTPRLLADQLDSDGRGRHEPAWAPDGRQLAFIRDGQLWLADVADGAARQVPLDASLERHLLLWHPAGGALLARASDERLWLVPTDGTPARTLVLPEGRDRPTVLRRQETTWFWSPDGASLVICTQEIASRRGEFWRISLAGGQPVLLLAEERAFNAGPASPISSAFGDVSADGQHVVYAAEDETQPPEFWLADPSFRERRQVTQRSAHLAEALLGRSRLVSWTSVGGRRIQGALLLPAHVAPGQRVPLVVGLYPGLNLSDGLHRWSGGMLWAVIHRQQLASRGYAVLDVDVPAPEPFRPPEEPLAGIVVPGLHRLVEEGLVDGEHLAVIGQSGGGLATLQLLTQTPVFRAAVVSSAGGNFSSLFGQLRLNPDGSPDMYGVHNAEGWCGGPPWAQPLRYVEESPLFALDRVRTPVLLVSGLEDTATATERVGEVFVGLRRLEREVTLLRYRGEGHVPANYGEANRRDVTERVLAWLDTHLRAPLP